LQVDLEIVLMAYPELSLLLNPEIFLVIRSGTLLVVQESVFSRREHLFVCQSPFGLDSLFLEIYLNCV
jgi:hypothetical protein